MYRIKVYKVEDAGCRWFNILAPTADPSITDCWRPLRLLESEGLEAEVEGGGRLCGEGRKLQCDTRHPLASWFIFYAIQDEELCPPVPLAA